MATSSNASGTPRPPLAPPIPAAAPAAAPDKPDVPSPAAGATTAGGQAGAGGNTPATLTGGNSTVPTARRLSGSSASSNQRPELLASRGSARGEEIGVGGGGGGNAGLPSTAGTSKEGGGAGRPSGGSVDQTGTLKGETEVGSTDAPLSSPAPPPPPLPPPPPGAPLAVAGASADTTSVPSGAAGVLTTAEKGAVGPGEKEQNAPQDNKGGIFSDTPWEGWRIRDPNSTTADAFSTFLSQPAPPRAPTPKEGRVQWFVVPLQELCMRVVAENFEQYPNLGNLNLKQSEKIISLMRTDLPLELAGRLISEEMYWRKRACLRWKNSDLHVHGGSWKQLYFEKNISTALETFDPTSMDVIALKRLLKVSYSFVHGLTINQLPSHLDLSVVIDICSLQLSSLALTYGLANVGMDFDRSLFGMKVSDCRSLASALTRAECLTHLDLSNNLLDDDKVRVIVAGIYEKRTVTHLDLSHNHVTERGMRALTKILDAQRSTLAFLNLFDNFIHSEGARTLAKVLPANSSLLSLNLALNRISDDGASKLFDSLVQNKCLERLSLNSNLLSAHSAFPLKNLLLSNSSGLIFLDISCNAEIGSDGGEVIREGLDTNTTMRVLDARQCNIGQIFESSIDEVLRTRYDALIWTALLNGKVHVADYDRNRY
ncbi:hypothetical protein CBR_g48796 [Chara braunii]|uniref:Uncharacterized protein n=1 Tax=Chara braunii TaxID=69332 RepID=A0A388M3H2_CHABU|nr:hypothetical protein CBR_g48796 [Chara braunii]|eukprot:GBG89086.1 hypothetical protein CBR_g48796 [Chara braunii]